MMSTRTSGSEDSGSRSSKLAIRARRGTAILQAAAPGRRDIQHILRREPPGLIEPGDDAQGRPAGAR